MTFMLVDTIWPDNSASRVNQRMQFTWVEQKGVPKIRVIFISNAIQYDERDGIYPVHYDENYRKFVLTGETRSERIYVKGIDKSILYPELVACDLCGKSRQSYGDPYSGSGV